MTVDTQYLKFLQVFNLKVLQCNFLRRKKNFPLNLFRLVPQRELKIHPKVVLVTIGSIESWGTAGGHVCIHMSARPERGGI